MAYYFGLTPNEFWNCRYSEITKFIQNNMERMLDDYRKQIILQDATTDKLIKADAMSNKSPKIVSLREMFKNLFEK